MSQARDPAIVAPLEDGEPVAAMEYVLDEIDSGVPEERYDPERELRISYPAADDTIDFRDRYDDPGYLPIDSDSLHRSYGIKALAGDPDIHGRNIQVTADGRTYPHDFEAAGQYGLERMYSQIRDRLTGKSMFDPSLVTATQMRFGIGLDGRVSPGGLRDAIDALSDEIDRSALIAAYEDDERIRFDAKNIDDPETPAEQIISNIETAKQDEYMGTIEDLYDSIRTTI